MTSIKMPFDAVIVLSQSDWSTEKDSNRHQYTTRFAKSVPVYFVQGNQTSNKNEIIIKEGRINVINPKFGFSVRTLEMVFSMIPRTNRLRVLIWVYSPFYHEALQHINIPSIIVYHASEAYIGSGAEHSNDLLNPVKKTINRCSLIVSEFKEISNALKVDTDVLTPVLTLNSGYDYNSLNSLNKPKREKVYDEKVNVLIQKLSKIEVSENKLNKEKKKYINNLQ